MPLLDSLQTGNKATKKGFNMQQKLFVTCNMHYLLRCIQKQNKWEDYTIIAFYGAKNFVSFQVDDNSWRGERGLWY